MTSLGNRHPGGVGWQLAGAAASLEIGPIVLSSASQARCFVVVAWPEPARRIRPSTGCSISSRHGRSDRGASFLVLCLCCFAPPRRFGLEAALGAFAAGLILSGSNAPPRHQNRRGSAGVAIRDDFSSC